MKPKILFLLHRVPPVYGVTLLNEEILKSRPLNDVFDSEVVSINTAKNFQSINRWSPLKVFAFVGMMLRLSGKLLFNRYDLCYMSLTPSGAGFIKDCFFVSLVKLFAIPLVFHIHGKGIASSSRRYAWVLKGAYVILPVEYLKKDIQEYVDEKRIFILPNAVSQKVGEDQLKSKEHLRNDRPVLICLSNMVRSKGVMVALESSGILDQKGLDFEIWFAGQWYDIEEDEFWREAQKHGIKGRGKYLGYLSDSQKYEALLKADIFVYPTLKDIFGLVNIEAMQCALPVVTTREGGIPEVVVDGETGFVVEKNNPLAIAERVELLIKDPQARQRMGEASRKRYLQNYTFDRFERGLIKILKARIGNETRNY